MREILFRGFHPDEDGDSKAFVDGEWIKGYWVHGDLIHRKIGERNFLVIREEDNGFDYYKEYEVISNTAGQYIELTDKNQKKIFEGDIVDLSNCRQLPFSYDETSKISIVEWEGCYTGFYPFCDYDSDCGTSVCSEESKVIANIFENPDVVKFMNVLKNERNIV